MNASETLMNILSWELALFLIHSGRRRMKLKSQIQTTTVTIIDISLQILPLFVMEVLNYRGLVGLFMSSLFCASLR